MEGEAREGEREEEREREVGRESERKGSGEERERERDVVVKQSTHLSLRLLTVGYREDCFG